MVFSAATHTGLKRSPGGEDTSFSKRPDEGKITSKGIVHWLVSRVVMRGTNQVASGN